MESPRKHESSHGSTTEAPWKSQWKHGTPRKHDYSSVVRPCEFHGASVEIALLSLYFMGDYVDFPWGLRSAGDYVSRMGLACFYGASTLSPCSHGAPVGLPCL